MRNENLIHEWTRFYYHWRGLVIKTKRQREDETEKGEGRTVLWSSQLPIQLSI